MVNWESVGDFLYWHIGCGLGLGFVSYLTGQALGMVRRICL